MLDKGRREFISLLGGAAVAWPLGARAQKTGRLQQIAVLTLLSEQQSAPLLSVFRDGLRGRGYVEGQNISFDYRYSDGDVERLKPLAQELLSLKPDIVLAPEPTPARAMKAVAPHLPIVCVTLSDALIPELAASYARPGGTVTGIALTVEGLTGKLVELTTETIPGVSRIGFLSNPAGASMRLFADGVIASARTRGIAVLIQEASTRDDLAAAINRLAKQDVQVLIVPENGLFWVNRVQVMQLALAARLPTIFAERQSVDAGGLVSYGINIKENYRHAAVYVAKILKGANAGELPIEFPTKIELVINLRTAKALGLELSPQLLARADEVID
jgi:putative ABC transport system substrate-binding protein